MIARLTSYQIFLIAGQHLCVLVILIALVETAYPQSAPVQNNSAAQPPGSSASVLMKFIDARTGGAVNPTALLINGDPVDFTVDAGSLAVLALPSGKHSAEIQASGYISMTVDITVADAANPVMTFELDPNSTQSVEPVPPNVALLEGYVTDADTGTLLDGVTVTLPDAEMSTTTDTSGRYGFQVKVPPSIAARPTVTMEVQIEAYVPLRFKNLALAAGERRSMPVQLERMTSETQQLDIRETDESAIDGARRNYEWVFDVTVR